MGPLRLALLIVSGASYFMAATVWAQTLAPALGAGQQLGLLSKDERACPGYTLLSPLTSKNTYLIDLEGRVVHQWITEHQPGLSASLLANGNLLRPAAMKPTNQPFGGPGAAERIQELSWDGKLIWDYQFPSGPQLLHHDFTRLPNGNVLFVAWDYKTAEESIAAGRNPDAIKNNRLLSDCVLEIKPTGPTSGEIVWKWYIWDHLIQDHDPTKHNYGPVAEHPELIDVNLTEEMFGQITFDSEHTALKRPEHFAKRYTTDASFDWTHINCVAYNPELDQIVLSVRAFSEIWIIDHGTTVEEAASHKGGRYGKGGDLLYRWGNPMAYRAGKKTDQRLFKQHDARWIAPGLRGAGHILLFNNGNNRLDGKYSTADEIIPPLRKDGRYDLPASSPAPPASAAWTYAAPNKSDMFSMVVSGAQRLPNGNTLICSGASGTLIEVTADHEVVWKYVNPAHGSFSGYRPEISRLPKIGRGGLSPINNAVFRAERYSPDFPAFHKRDLTPGELLEDLARDEKRATEVK